MQESTADRGLGAGSRGAGQWRLEIAHLGTSHGEVLSHLTGKGGGGQAMQVPGGNHRPGVQHTCLFKEARVTEVEN